MLLDIIHTVCCEKDCFLKVGKKDIAAIINYELCSTIMNRQLKAAGAGRRGAGAIQHKEDTLHTVITQYNYQMIQEVSGAAKAGSILSSLGLFYKATF